jgi:hypothetical protein
VPDWGEAAMSKRSEAIAEWDRCTWCWRELGDDQVRRRGLPYCDERCAGNDLAVAEDGESEIVSVSDQQMSFE